jgi:bacterioferritin-associated ferredoxin
MDFGHPQTLASSTAHDGTRPICHCLNVTEGEIRQVIAENDLHSIRGVSQMCGAGAGCMSCHRHIRRFLNEKALHRRNLPMCGVSTEQDACPTECSDRN